MTWEEEPLTPTGLEPDGATACGDSGLGSPGPGGAAESGAARPGMGSQGAATDAELARVVDAWEGLPAHVRAAILALVEAT